MRSTFRQWPDDFDDGRSLRFPSQATAPIKDRTSGVLERARRLNSLLIMRQSSEGKIEVDQDKTIVARQQYAAKLPPTSPRYPTGFGVSTNSDGLLVFGRLPPISDD